MITKNPFVEFRIINKKGYLKFNHDVFEVDEVGQFIWSILDENTTTESIIKRTAEEFKENPEDIESDIHTFLKSLKEENLI